jgi:hypothetical protein
MTYGTVHMPLLVPCVRPVLVLASYWSVFCSEPRNVTCSLEHPLSWSSVYLRSSRRIEFHKRINCHTGSPGFSGTEPTNPLKPIFFDRSRTERSQTSNVSFSHSMPTAQHITVSWYCFYHVTPNDQQRWIVLLTYESARNNTNCVCVYVCVHIYIYMYIYIYDRLCGLVVRVLGYRSGGPGSIPGTNRKKSSGSGTGST